MLLIPKYEEGCEVRVIRNIRNDTNLGENNKGNVLVRRGEIGFVRQSGVYKQAQIIYQIHFLENNVIYGIKESELTLSSIPWVNNKFEYGDNVILNMGLSVAGQQIASKGDAVSILRVDRRESDNICYNIQINSHHVVVPERALAPGESK